ncbi:hypothetical protein KDX38_23220 [Pseudomonas sp. CDFA 602]|uniref:hypothetical protein n=1 Tax=Pseudomonas californiensis TaxID=2829823 RepID=UPI001E527463|nr:hypothetical protein [Pseudomonas californiensis]MCD5996504.1 hypothetical protein [Pseudomonas californiensis]MCD6002103.1 hypothetical protein [Pseudomonas californiensis]
MKVRALSRISGPMGSKLPGEEFIVDAATGADLIERQAVVEVVVEAGAPKPKAPGKKA